MKKVMIILLILSLVLMPTALAVKEAKVTGWYKYIDSFTFNKAEYTLKLMGGEYRPDDPEHNLNGGTLRIGKNDERVIVSLGSCHKNENHSYCFLNKSFDKEKIEIDSQGNLQPSIHIELIEYDYSSDVKITRQFEKTKFALYEEGQVEIIVENTGDHLITNARLTEFKPEGFNFTWQETKVINKGEELNANFNLLPGKTWSMKYKLQGIAYNKSSYQTTLLYDSEDGSNIEKLSSKATLEVLQPYSIKASMPKKVNRGDSAEFIVEITNNENEPLRVEDLRIEVPLSLGVSRRTNLNTYNFNTLGFNGEIGPKEKKTFLIGLTTPYVGSYTITYSGNLQVKNKEYELSGEQTMDVVTTGVNCYFTFNEPSLQAGRNLQYTVVLKNLGNVDDYYNINGTIETAFENIDFHVPTLFRENHKTIANRRYQIPFSTEDKEYPFRIKATYQTTQGQKFSCEEENNYLVKGAENIVDFDIFVSADKPSPGDDVNLIISITNELIEDISDITIFTNTTDGDITQGVSTKKLTTLASQAKTKLYTVTVHIPENYDKEKLEVYTTAIVGSHDYTDVETTIISIKPVPQEDETSVDEEDGQQEQEDTPDEKDDTKQPTNNEDDEEVPDGFFAKVWHFLKKLW